MSVEGLRAAPQRDGYGRYFRFRTDLGEVIPGSLFLCVNYHLWATSGDTPLWLWIDGDVPFSPARLRDNICSLVEHGSSGPYDVPIYLTPGVEYGRVLNDVVRRVKVIREMANGHLTLSERDDEQLGRAGEQSGLGYEWSRCHRRHYQKLTEPPAWTNRDPSR